MSHKSQFIECDPRETEIIRSATSFLVVVKLGRGQESRRKFPSFRLAQLNTEELCRDVGRGASVYAIGTAGGLETSALYATFIPGTSTWKFAEAAPEAQGV